MPQPFNSYDNDRLTSSVRVTRPKRRPKRVTCKETGGCGLPLARLKADRTPVVVPFTETKGV